MTTGNSANIELIPWVHNSPNLYHQQVVEYIRKKVPKNSFLALEVTQKELNNLNYVLQEYYKYRFTYKQFLIVSHSLNVLKGTLFGAIDVLNECYKKKHKNNSYR